MKRFFIPAALAVITLAACKGNQVAAPTFEQEILRYDSLIDAVYNDTTTSDDRKDALYRSILDEMYGSHPSDSIGLYAFKQLMIDFWDIEESESQMEKAAPLISQSIDLQRRLQAKKNAVNQAPGKQFYDLTGPDAIDGHDLTISQFYGQGKRIIVDFWASWCSPCRKEISSHLLDLASDPDYTIVGIAVWEESVEDTRKAIGELGISWPVIYTGGRENSPSLKYGVTGIPTLFVLDENGTVLGTGHSISSILESID